MQWTSIKYVGELDNDKYHITIPKVGTLEQNSNVTYRAYAIVDGAYEYGDEFTVSTGNEYIPPQADIFGVDVTTSGATGTLIIHKYNGIYDFNDNNVGIIYRVGSGDSLIVDDSDSSIINIQPTLDNDGGHFRKYSFSLVGLSSSTKHYYRGYVKYNSPLDTEYKYSDVKNFSTKHSLVPIPKT